MTEPFPGRGFAGKPSVSRCAMCEIRNKQHRQDEALLADAKRKIDSLKEELTRTQQASARTRESRGSQEAIEADYRRRKERFHERARVMMVFMRYVRGVLAMLKTMRDHPQGGFCQFCDAADSRHEAGCVLVKVFDDPASVVAAQADVDEAQLPIPPELRTVELKKLLETPWEIDKDPSKTCGYGSCGGWVVRGERYCGKHLLPPDGGSGGCVVIGCRLPVRSGGVRCAIHA